MPKISAADGTRLYVEEIGAGTPVVFVHEYAGDYRSFEPQLRYFSRQHRCVTFSQRGYPPSDVPSDPARYSQAIARDDVIAVMDALGIDRAHVVGHSMGAMQGVKAAQDAPERIAAVAALGGGGWFKASEPLKAVAFFVGVGTRDSLMGSATRALKKGLLEAGVKTVVDREYVEVEHMLVWQVALPEVFALFDKVAGR